MPRRSMFSLCTYWHYDNAHIHNSNHAVINLYVFRHVHEQGIDFKSNGAKFVLHLISPRGAFKLGADLQSFTKILRLHRFSAPSPDKAMLWVWWEDFLEWKWSFGNNIALSREGAEILLPFRKEQICFHKKEQKIRPLGVGLNIFCEGLWMHTFLEGKHLSGRDFKIFYDIP